MPYILRNDEGNVCAVSLEGQPGWDRVALSDPGIIEFLAECSSAEDLGRLTDLAGALSQSDGDVRRLAEDLLTVLIDKGILGEADLPDPVFNSLRHRQMLRKEINDIFKRAAEFNRIRAGLSSICG